MADKSNFTPEEWKMILASPMLSGVAVTLAEPSGLWGRLKEAMASGGAQIEAGLDRQQVCAMTRSAIIVRCPRFTVLAR